LCRFVSTPILRWFVPKHVKYMVNLPAFIGQRTNEALRRIGELSPEQITALHRRMLSQMIEQLPTPKH